MPIDAELLKQLTATFATELDEQLQVITTGLLELEKGQVDDQEREKIIASIFRAAHNIKGASRSLSITNISEIAHRIESIFSLIQKRTIKINKKVIDVCLAAGDKMRIAMQNSLMHLPLEFNLDDCIKELEQFQVIPGEKQSIPPKEEIKKNDTELSKSESRVGVKSHDTIRIPIANIDKVSALMEEMQINKIAIDEHYSGIVKLSQETKRFSEIWRQLHAYSKSNAGKTENDLLQKMCLSGADIFAEMANDIQYMRKNMHGRINELALLTNSLQDEVRMLRLVPVSDLLCTMPRYVRDIGHELQKQVELHIHGDEVKMDKMLLEELKDPIIHLLRNSIDHGIESADVRKTLGKPEIGQIKIDIHEEGGRIYFCFTDDGAGIDANQVGRIALEKNLITNDELLQMSEHEKIMLIFMPGFTTKKMITDVSGRGVGLDVVKSNMDHLHGTVVVKTTVGKGTTFELSVPLTLSTERGLMIACCGQLFVVPTNSVQRVLTVSTSDVFEVEGSEAILLDDHPVSLHYLADILALNQSEQMPTSFSVMVVKKGWELAAIVVDEIIGEREIVIKPLRSPLTKIPCVEGGTLSGTNQVILVLNPNDIIDLAFHTAHSRHIQIQTRVDTISKPHILVVDDSITTRSLEKNILESKNYEVTVAVNGKEAWDILQEQAFSLLITDVSMPIMDGFTLTDRVKHSEKLHDMPVIIVTSLGSDAEKKRGIDVGADAYIVKDEFDSGSLLKIVEQLV